MLTHIYIKNFAIIDTLDVDFTDGLNVLTGETGAGKSLWVDAIQLALGQRADLSCIRPGNERTDISVTFDISQSPAALAWLQQENLDQGCECIIRRTLTSQGTSRSTVNGSPMPLQRIRDLAEQLIQIHSQHQQQHLLHNDQQRRVLDEFAKNQTVLEQIHEVYQRWNSTCHAIAHSLTATHNKDHEIEFLTYQLNELHALNLQPGEWQTLSHQHQQLHNAKNLLQQLNQAIELTVESEPICAEQLIQQALHQLDSIKIDDPQLTAIRELLHTAAIHVSEAGNELTSYRRSIDLNTMNSHDIETRLSVIYDLARKHHCNPEDLKDIERSLQCKLDTLHSLDAQLTELTAQQEELERQYQDLAKQLTTARQNAARQLEQHISQAMRSMDIQDAVFQVSFTTHESTPTAYGHERINFLVQTNAGQGLQPLHKIASGGELSRISLALHVLTASREHTPTLVFDEVDVGISGKTATMVGKLLRQLGTTAQVLCITHLPQVAANGHHHYKVSKQSDGTDTTTYIQKLDDTARIDEIARLLGGTELTQKSRLHAKELLISLTHE